MRQSPFPHLYSMKSKKTGKAKDLDQFYTNPVIAKTCIDLVNILIPESKRQFFLEPSAGTGSFSMQLDRCVSVDLDPKIPNVIHSDFLILKKNDIFKETETKNVCVIGNPPFGKNSSLAVKFFNHSTKFGDVIAFIIPKTFRKVSLQNKLNLNFHLIKDIDLPKNSFVYEGEDYNVPCCFQIWEKKDTAREKIAFTESPLIEFVKKNEGCDFAVRRAGGTAGQAKEDFKDCKEPSFHFLKLKTKEYSIKELIEIINSIDFSKEANSTAGVRSISKGELVNALHKKIDSLS
jgi:hypothetical protein